MEMHGAAAMNAWRQKASTRTAPGTECSRTGQRQQTTKRHHAVDKPLPNEEDRRCAEPPRQTQMRRRTARQQTSDRANAASPEITPTPNKPSVLPCQTPKRGGETSMPRSHKCQSRQGIEGRQHEGCVETYGMPKEQVRSAFGNGTAPRVRGLNPYRTQTANRAQYVVKAQSFFFVFVAGR